MMGHPARLLLWGIIYWFAAATLAGASDADILLKFKGTIADADVVLAEWIAGSSPCIGNKANWTGIICGGGSVLGLQLENMSLSGSLNLDGISGLPGVRTLSFKNNSFQGLMPNIGNLRGLRSIYLSMNNLSGQIPDDAFQGLGSLRRVHLYMNQFSGPIPSSLTGLQRLVELRLDDNSFDGGIPDFQQRGLQLVNVSNNNLSGQIPDGLNRMEASLFAGNRELCGPLLEITCKNPKKLSTALIVSITVGVVITAGLIIAIIYRRRQDKKDQLGRVPTVGTKDKAKGIQQRTWDEHGGYVKKATTTTATAAAAEEYEQGTLVFVREDRERFVLQDLFRASAEVLGNGSFGSSYKAVVMNGSCVVVKRFKEMNRVGKEGFHEHMRKLGKLSHPNLLPFLAYYYREEEKFLVTDFIPNGSLANLLHGNSDCSNSVLDWPTRLKIVKGVARGLAFLYEELPTLNVPHGQLKSSNVLLDESLEPLLADYALGTLINQSHSAQAMVVYKSPEWAQYGRTSKKSDVWSLGILILELLTGKSPGNYLRQGRADTEIVRWVNSVVREEWTGEVFDNTMRRARNNEVDMLKLLQIGLGCCDRDVQRRWDMRGALIRIEELREGSNDDDFPSIVSGTGETYYSSRAMTEEDFCFSATNE